MNDFKRGFLLELVFVALVTVIAMSFSHIFVHKLYSDNQKTQEYTTQKSQYNQNDGEN